MWHLKVSTSLLIDVVLICMIQVSEFFDKFYFFITSILIFYNFTPEKLAIIEIRKTVHF